MKYSYLIISLAYAVTSALTLSPAGWRAQSIYQVLTDRFARTDGSTTATCNTGDQIYCGGSWQGIINHLDYIQDMGFTAVSNR
jgi:alpha-amylase